MENRQLRSSDHPVDKYMTKTRSTAEAGSWCGRSRLTPALKLFLSRTQPSLPFTSSYQPLHAPLQPGRLESDGPTTAAGRHTSPCPEDAKDLSIARGPPPHLRGAPPLLTQCGKTSAASSSGGRRD